MDQCRRRDQAVDIGVQREAGRAAEERDRDHFSRRSALLIESLNSTAIDVANRKAALFQFDVPASNFAPGLYTCQVNVIDEAGGKFTFPRLAFYVR